jgi:Flp pilus assembly protein TadB
LISLFVIAFILLVSGIFILLKISPISFVDNIVKLVIDKPETNKSKIKKAQGKKKQNLLQRELSEAKTILEATNRSDIFSLICISAIGLFVLGILISTAISNLFLVPILACGMFLIPFWYLKLTKNNYKKHINAELETALSIISSSYMRNDDIITAVEENVAYLNPPVSELFKDFLMQTRFNANISQALLNIKKKLDNEVFHEWLDGLIACQSDRTLKNTLSPIVSKLSDIRMVSGELEYLLFEPRKELITMAILLVGNIPMLYFLNRTWFDTLMFSIAGKAVLAISAAALFVSFAAMIRLTKPIEYRR